MDIVWAKCSDCTLDDMIISSGERNVGCSLMSMLRVILVWSSGFYYWCFGDIILLKYNSFFSVMWLLRYCLISRRAGDWHYRIFADFVLVLYSRFKMAASNPNTHLKCQSKLSTFEAIKCDISPENLPSLGKESLKQYCKELRLKVTGKSKNLLKGWLL